jgi:hypothetical protein
MFGGLIPREMKHMGQGVSASQPRALTARWLYDTVIHMDEVLTIRVPKGMRRKIEKRARAENLTVSQYVRRALESEQLVGAFEAARAELLPLARARGIYTDEDVFKIVS